MSIIDTPMALLDRLLGRRAIPPDDPLVRRIERVMRRLEPDPLFERRLRSAVVNQYVAAREGIARPHSRREMGRLGRAVLYASLGLALTATAAGAAAHEALPGDFLYAAKLRLEEFRMEIAPASVRPSLSALAAEERLDELETLAAAGDWERVNAAAPMVELAVERLAAFGLPDDAPELQGVQHHLAVLEELLADAPAAAQAGLQQALEASSAAGVPPEAGAGTGPADGHGRSEEGPVEAAKPTKSPKPTPPAAEASEAPAATDDQQQGAGHDGAGNQGGAQGSSSQGGPPEGSPPPLTGP